MKLLVFGLSLMFASFAQARTFDFKADSFATYFRGSYGTSNLHDAAYDVSSGSGTSFNESTKTAYSGEFGILISGTKVNFRLGVEYLKPNSYADLAGSDSSGTQLFTLSSRVAAAIPKAMFEYVFYQSGTSRAFVGGGGGMAFVTLDNDYTLTSAGKTAYPSVTSPNESATAQAIEAEAYVGYEFLFTDNVTLDFDLGYRYLPVSSLTSTTTSTTFTGTEASGSPLLTNSGGTRTIDLGGGYVSASFQFYLF